MKSNEDWLCGLLCEHDYAVTELVKAVNRSHLGHGSKTAARRLRSVNRRIFKFITDRSPTAKELDACESV